MTCIDNNSQKNFFIFHELTNILAIHVCAIVCTINVHVLSVFVQCKSHAEFSLKKEQLANYFISKEDIFELIPNQKTNQIFTPKKVVLMMINKLEEHSPSLFARTDSRFIDLYMKSGMYITEIVKKLFNNTHIINKIKIIKS